jgi:hypothetical protein
VDALLPRSNAGVLTIEEDKGRVLRLFGNWFTGMLAKELTPLSLWCPGELASLTYSDRYLRSPLNAIVALKALSAVRDVLAGKDVRAPLRLISSSDLGQSNSYGPYLLPHDWVRPQDRGNVLRQLATALKFDVDLKLTNAQHARELQIAYKSGATARLYFDQGFGYWRALAKERFDFAASADAQSRALLKVNPFVCGRGGTYIVASRAH